MFFSRLGAHLIIWSFSEQIPSSHHLESNESKALPSVHLNVKSLAIEVGRGTFRAFSGAFLMFFSGLGSQPIIRLCLKPHDIFEILVVCYNYMLVSHDFQILFRKRDHDVLEYLHNFYWSQDHEMVS